MMRSAPKGQSTNTTMSRIWFSTAKACASSALSWRSMRAGKAARMRTACWRSPTVMLSTCTSNQMAVWTMGWNWSPIQCRWTIICTKCRGKIYWTRPSGWITAVTARIPAGCISISPAWPSAVLMRRRRSALPAWYSSWRSSGPSCCGSAVGRRDRSTIGRPDME